MTSETIGNCCPGGSADDHDRSHGGCRPSRGQFRAVTMGLAAGTVVAGSRAVAAAALGVPEEELRSVPMDKAVPPDWTGKLYSRGQPTSYEGTDLRWLGMPVGGGCAGQLYLGGDGKLWHWDIFNLPAAGTGDGGYANPREPSSPIRHGFALRTRSGGQTQTRGLDSSGFETVRFTGQYPIGRVHYGAADSPVEVELEAFSPFVPLSVADSTLPATILTYTLHNTSDRTVDATLLGFVENPACLDARSRRAINLRSAAFREGPAHGIQFSAVEPPATGDRPDIVFEDWERDTYAPWTVQGTAFGDGPTLVSDVPEYMLRFGDLGATGQRFVTSHAFWSGNADGHTGTLASPPFIVERNFVRVAVGGGSHQGQTCVNVIVDGEVVASVAGTNVEPMSVTTLNVAGHQGRTAVIEIVDTTTGGWGHVNVDRIVFSDAPADARPLTEVPDNGTLALAALDPYASTRPSLARWDSLDDVFDAGNAPTEVDASRADQAGSVAVPVRLAPGQRRTVTYVLGWHFPVPDRVSLAFLRGSDTLRRHYAGRFADARAVVRHVVINRQRLESDTRSWVDTWYTDSSLPHWFLERTLAPASTLATSTCYLFDDGRFYGWEGVYCCAGTCEHVWNYAQSIARLFPQLERDTRSRVDLGVGFHPDTGEIGNRAEADMGWATDGMCGTVLRFYREHLTAPGDAFLRINWVALRRALDWIIDHDLGPDGILDGPQPNTLDQVWYGQIAWISGMYIAALQAGAAMAEDVGQADFAARCRALAESGSRYMSTELFNGEYFIQKVDPAYANIVNTNRGCHIDQLFGQSLAGQLGLPRVVPAGQAASALRSLYRYNFTPNHIEHRERSAITGGRWFAMDQEYGMLMTTWPNGGDETAAGDPPSWAAVYFNEVWTGQEYQLAAHMLREGVVEEALTITRAVHERYAAGKRNPYNEVECGDHYARAMASHGVYLSACGFEYHGPRAHIGFGPKWSPEKFAAAFTAAEGWGLYRQSRRSDELSATIAVRYGRLRVNSVALEPAERAIQVAAWLDGRPVRVAGWSQQDGQTLIELDRAVVVNRGAELRILVQS